MLLHDVCHRVPVFKMLLPKFFLYFHLFLFVRCCSSVLPLAKYRLDVDNKLFSALFIINVLNLIRVRDCVWLKDHTQ